jgi:hypothetical protein
MDTANSDRTGGHQVAIRKQNALLGKIGNVEIRPAYENNALGEPHLVYIAKCPYGASQTFRDQKFARKRAQAHVEKLRHRLHLCSTSRNTL